MPDIEEIVAMCMTAACLALVVAVMVVGHGS